MENLERLPNVLSTYVRNNAITIFKYWSFSVLYISQPTGLANQREWFFLKPFTSCRTLKYHQLIISLDTMWGYIFMFRTKGILNPLLSSVITLDGRFFDSTYL